jgi:hypothetical protein
MGIRDERTATNEILRDARYHQAAVMADPGTAHLAKTIRDAREALKKARELREEADELRTEKLAVLLRTDYDLDEQLALAELALLAHVKKDRAAPAYRAVFPKGLSPIVGLRGEEEAREVKALLAPLKKHAPTIEQQYGKELRRLADESVAVENEWAEAETAAARAFADELRARTDLVRRLQKNEGALVMLYPGDRRRVRSFFRQTKRGTEQALHPGTPAASRSGEGNLAVPS